MKNIYPVLLLFCIICTLSTCITAYEPEGIISTENILVVEGSIIAPYGTFIKLSKSRKITDDSNYTYIKDAAISIIADDGSIIASVDSKIENDTIVPGEYEVKEKLTFAPGLKYAVQIKTENKLYQSEYVEPLYAPEIDNVTWQHEEAKSVDIKVSTHNTADASIYYRWIYQEDWEIRSEFVSHYAWSQETGVVRLSVDSPNNTYYCWDNATSHNFLLGKADNLKGNSIKDQLLVSHKPQNSRFSYLYSMLVKQHALSKEAYEYFRNLQKNIDQTGSIFAPQPTDMKGNISCVTNPEEVVIGYINATTETTHRIYIDGKDVADMADVYDCKERFNYPITELHNIANQGLGILDEVDKYTFVCMPIRCVDCTARGGTKKRPAFWPNNHQ